MKSSTRKKTGKSIFSKVGIFSVSLLAASTAVYLYSPVLKSNALTSQTARMNLEVNEVASLILDKDLLEVASTMYSFSSGTINAIVSTNSQYGYTLTLEDTDSSPNLTHEDANISDVFSSVFEGTKTSTEMTENSWGFSIDSTDFKRIPVNGSPATIKKTTTKMADDNETTAVDFGVKAGSIASGAYMDSVLFTMYTNGVDEMEIMQNFTCNSLSEIGYSTVLKDFRDGHVYTVTKLADGKCWMTENLRLVGPLVLTSSNSDVTDPFELPDSTDASDWTYERVNQTDNLSNVPMLHASDNPEYGAYYNWYTATAGTGDGDSVTSATAPSSICPSGWHLPTDREWYNFTYAYSGDWGTMDGTTAVSDPISMVYSGAVYAPAYYNSWQAYIGNAGQVGYLWSASRDNVNPITMDVYDSTNTTGYGHDTAMTLSHTYRGDGYAIRCVAD